MKVFVLIRNDFETNETHVDQTVSVFKQRSDAIKFVLDYYNDLKFLSFEIDKKLCTENYFYDDCGNDPIEWKIIETELN